MGGHFGTARLQKGIPKGDSENDVIKIIYFGRHFHQGDYSNAGLRISKQDCYRRPLEPLQREYQASQSGAHFENETDVDGFKLVSSCGDEVVEREIEWLWPSFLPRGVLTMYSGE